ncbi:MAG: transcriptional regulator [Chloroflexi bacterium RBG_16_57_11]|nr:MAG: transcriptional regulator [Chloroflexi bacterium RBG_16_57_11]
MALTCKLVQKEAQPVLSIRTFTTEAELPALVGRVYGAIAQYLGELGESPAGPPFAAYYNMDMQHLDTELGFPVGKALPGRGEIQSGEIPGGWRASVLYTGPYQGMGSGYEALTEFVKASGREATGVAIEFYLNSPMDTPVDGLQTLIVFPLKD